MKIREAEIDDVEDLQELYLEHLTKDSPKEPQLKENWIALLKELKQDSNYHLLVCEVDGKAVSSITLVAIKNLNHNLRPYSVIENVVTHPNYRNKGYASRLMEEATKIARAANCYKIMLMTGSKKESTLNFYKRNGFTSEKTAFQKRL